MSSTKEYFINLAEQMFFKNQLGFFDWVKEPAEEYETEEFEVDKGDYKTIITLRFNKQGYPVSHGYHVMKK